LPGVLINGGRLAGGKGGWRVEGVRGARSEATRRIFLVTGLAKRAH